MIEDQAADARRLRAEVAGHAAAGVPVVEKAVADGSLDAGALVAAWQAAIEADPGILRASTGFRAPSGRRVRRREESLAPVLAEAERAVTTLLVRASEVSGAAIGDAIAGDPGLPGGAALRAVVAGDPEIDACGSGPPRARPPGGPPPSGSDSTRERTRPPCVAPDAASASKACAPSRSSPPSGTWAPSACSTGSSVRPRPDLLDEVRADLVDTGRAVVLEEEGPYAERLDLPSLQDEAATPVRLRLAELRRLV